MTFINYINDVLYKNRLGVIIFELRIRLCKKLNSLTRCAN